MSVVNPPTDEPHESRRDFLYILTGAMGAAGVAAMTWPLIDQLNPASDVLARGSPLTVDLTKVAPGQQITVLWRSYPIIIVRRTPANLAELRNPADLELLRDPDSITAQQPSYAKNWSRAIRPEFLVLVGICTHLGCIPGYHPSPGEVAPNWPGGWLCPCHGSKYDLAGRVFKYVPAPLNLPVPPYHFASDTKIVIGKDPPGVSFKMSDITTL